jgi:hypothetical protein
MTSTFALTPDGHAAQARSYSATASADTMRGRRDARQAAGCWLAAARSLDQARRLAGRPDLWDLGAEFTPAEHEARALSWDKMARIYLRSSWRADGQAAFHRDLAARYRAMAGRAAGRARY